MIKKLGTGLLLACLFHQFSVGQIQTYTVEKALLSSDKYDEFSPVFYKNGIVFCSNRDKNMILSYSTSDNKGQFKINYIDTTDLVIWNKSRIFSKDLSTNLNDGPVTFNASGDTIFYSRNQNVKGNMKVLSGARNKLGIFTAVKEGSHWIDIKGLRINSDWYNTTTPWLSPDGKRLYFASDRPDGYGGTDLYYSEWKGYYWDDPVNLGPVINTKGNEIYPYITPAGELMFASDGRKGKGGKDIFFSRLENGKWMTPVGLDAPVNSEFDDFGIVTDTLMSEGYFSSTRNGSIDIFHFKSNFPQIFYDNIQKENNYCLFFADSNDIDVDTFKLSYEWSFGDGTKAYGREVTHCYSEQGDYKVTLNLIDKATGSLFFSKLLYSLELRDFEQPYISSNDILVKKYPYDFDGFKSYMPDYKITDYYWDFGDGTRAKGSKVTHSYTTPGAYKVNLELNLRSNISGKIKRANSSKQVVVVNSLNEKSDYESVNPSDNVEPLDVRMSGNANLRTIYSADNEFVKNTFFCIELISSNKKLGVNNALFANISKKYTVREIYDKGNGTYRYVINRQPKLMSTYIAFREMPKYGFKDSKVIMEKINNPAEKEINDLLTLFGVSTDLYFDKFNKLTSNAYLMLDQLLKIMSDYPGVKLEIEIYTDNSGTIRNNIELSENYANTITNYLIGKGIKKERLIPKGYGSTRPIATNSTINGRSLNRRIDLLIVP